MASTADARDPLQGTSLCHFRIRGTKKSQELPGEKICHPQRSRIPTCSKQWPCRDNGATNPKSWRKDLHQNQISWEGRRFRQARTLGPYSGETECISLKHRSERRSLITPRIQIQPRREAHQLRDCLSLVWWDSIWKSKWISLRKFSNSW